jgi:hypothetical protein
MKARIPKGHVWWEATKNAETNSNQLQRQVASQEAQLNEAESVIDRQQQSIEESADPIDKTGISKQERRQPAKRALSPDNKLASVPPSRITGRRASDLQPSEWSRWRWLASVIWLTERHRKNGKNGSRLIRT